jgi:uncharacterized protein (DUF488 family)
MRFMDDKLTILTIGHSNRTLDDFVELLKAHGVEFLVDIRTVPRSRRNPDFNVDALPISLNAVGIAHLHMSGLGGLRHARPDSPNKGWQNSGFQGYADYMQTVEFASAVESLIELAWGQRVAVMCAEAVPWRCHRSLLSDALTVRGITVEHIMTKTRRQKHTLTPFAKVEGTRLMYPLPIKEEGGTLTFGD